MPAVATRRSTRTRKPLSRLGTEANDEDILILSDDSDDNDAPTTSKKINKKSSAKDAKPDENLELLSEGDDDESVDDDLSLTSVDDDDDLSVVAKKAAHSKKPPAKKAKALVKKKTATGKNSPCKKTASTTLIANKKANSNPPENSNELSDDDDDEDDDDEDIGAMLEKVKGKHARKSSTESSSEEEDSDSEDDSDEEHSEQESPGSTKRARFSQRLNQKNKKQKLSKMAKRALDKKPPKDGYGHDADSDDEEDSDSECEVVDLSKPLKKKLNTSIEELSDSEDELPASSCKQNTDSEFAKAFAQLQSAQQYHAEDLDVPEPEAPKIPNSVLKSRSKGSADVNDLEAVKEVKVVKKKQNYGPPMSVKLRTGKDSEETYTIRMREPMQALLNMYVKRNNIEASKVKHVSLLFDGEKLDLNSTPNSHDMENDDLIDVVVKE